MNKITAYTDGSAVLKYPYKGGFGVLIKAKNKNIKIRKGYCFTKTGRMELKAVLTCLKSIKNKSTILTIYSDSMYVVNTCNQWIDNWERQMWQDKKNVDILKELIVELRRFQTRPTLKHVKGHQEIKEDTPKGKIKHIEGNCIVDELANYKTQKSWEVDIPITKAPKHFEGLESLTEFEKEDFKEINGKMYYDEVVR